MNYQTDLTNKLAVDSRGLDQLKLGAKKNSPEALKAVSQQFEAVFMNMMLKSMREASPQDGAFDSEETKMYTSMLDQQITQNMGSKGIGLADALYKQMLGATQPGLNGGNNGLNNQGPSKFKAINQYQQGAVAPLQGSQAAPVTKAAEFKQRMMSHAQRASQETGIPADFMIGQAALESGWGKREIRAADGSTSHNVFGIKAGSGWKGKTVSAVTTEYVDGVAQKKVEKFRAYDSYSDAFKDYAHTLSNNPRYGQVIANAKDANSFAVGLQKAGYATDPNYAAKLSKIIQQTTSV